MSFRLIYLDTNIIIRAVEGSPDDDLAQAIVTILMASETAPRARFVTSDLTLAEVLVYPLKKGDSYLADYYRALISPQSTWLDVVPITRNVLIAATRFRSAARLKLPDAIHLATAVEADCSHVLSFDADFAVTGDFLGAPLPPVLKPTSESIYAVIEWLKQ